MESILLVVHVVVALLIVGLIMLQQGKGAEMGASFGGGGSQTVFGAAGSGNFFSRMTAIFVAVFFVTSFVLAIMAQRSVGVNDSIIPFFDDPVEQGQPAAVPLSEPLDAGEVPVSEPAGDAIPEADNAAGTDSIPQSNSTGDAAGSQNGVPETP